MLTTKDAYKEVVEFKQQFEEKYADVKDVTSDFELISDVWWKYVDDEVLWWDKDKDEEDCCGWEVNWVIYEDDFYIHFDCDNGCGDRHISVVFLKSEQVEGE